MTTYTKQEKNQGTKNPKLSSQNLRPSPIYLANEFWGLLNDIVKSN